jgi:hypothetical protein
LWPTWGDEIVSNAFLLAAESRLFVTDIGASYDFYAQKLGFNIAFSYGDLPYQ